MSKRIVVTACALVFVWLAFSGKSAAQTSNPCLHIWWEECWPGDICIWPGVFIVGPGPGGWTLTVGGYLASCPPSNAGDETCTGCSSPGGAPPTSPAGAPPATPGGTPSAGRPISLTTGNTFIDQTDIRLPGLGGGLSLVRRWNSVWPSSQIASSVGMFGPNWRSTYEERVFMAADNYLKYSRSDGTYWSFGFGPGGPGGPGTTMILAAPANVYATFVAGSSNWTITFLNGEQRQFNPATGLLTAIVDRNGNATQLTYDSTNRLVTVTDPASRHLYFNYGTSSGLLVTSVTSDFGITVSYAYDTQGRLIQVTDPDLTTVSFTYNAQSQITAVTDNNGKILESHTYDSSGRGLTSSRANGVESVTITYPQ